MKYQEGTFRPSHSSYANVKNVNISTRNGIAFGELHEIKKLLIEKKIVDITVFKNLSGHYKATNYDNV